MNVWSSDGKPINATCTTSTEGGHSGGRIWTWFFYDARMTSSLVELRRELHANPELSHHEHGTAARVVAFLERLSPDRILTGIGGTGLIATFDSGVEGPTLLFRCELDALPIVELDVHGHASTVDGVSHKLSLIHI